MEKIWEGVPTDIDLLLTHSPPYGILDQTLGKEGENIRAGSQTIKRYCEKTSAKVHIFGHIHEAKGEK